MVIHQSGYLWTVKQRQYRERAEPTEKLVRIGSSSDGTIYAKCFPYAPIVGELALRYRLDGGSRPTLITGPLAASHPLAIDFCTAAAH